MAGCHNFTLKYSDTGVIQQDPIFLMASGNALTHQWGHVSSMHLPCGDLLLCRGHGAHIEGVRAAY